MFVAGTTKEEKMAEAMTPKYQNDKRKFLKEAEEVEEAEKPKKKKSKKKI